MAGSTSGRISIEDLRPHLLSEILGQDAAVRRLEVLARKVRAGAILPPHFLFEGPPGVGKTTAARAFAREVLGEDWTNGFHQLGGWDDRGEERLRRQILPDSLRPPSRGAVVRIVFFDEADGLSEGAQVALRPALEAEDGHSLFIFACNDLTKISAPVRSRCLLIRFGTVSEAEIERIVHQAMAASGLRLDAAHLAHLVEASRGVPRDAMKLLLELGDRPDDS